jgi:ubiquinol-cytochrome c reductase cytochrome c1 subunit
MKNIRVFFIASLLAFSGMATQAMASGDVRSAKDIEFSFEGPFGKFDKAQLQRGFQVYKEVCSSCHSMKYLSFRNLQDLDGPAFTEAEVKAIAAGYKVTDGPNAAGEMFERSALPSDGFISPFPNPETAMANLGAVPPDLSLLAKARAGWHGTFTQLFNGMGGPEYIYSVLTGYEPEPAGVHDKPEGKHYNPYFTAGNWISMPKPLSDGQVTYSDGTVATTQQMAKDVSTFLMWAAEPKLVERKRTGLVVMIFMSILAGLLYLCYKKLWRNIDH